VAAAAAAGAARAADTTTVRAGAAAGLCGDSRETCLPLCESLQVYPAAPE